LYEKRPFLVASLAAAIAYYFMSDDEIGGLYLIALKGCGVGLLAIYAATRHKSIDARILVAVMALGALGDMLLELSFTWGGAAFFIGHLTALWLYVRNPRPRTTPTQKAAAIALFVMVPITALLLTRDSALTLYATGLGTMAAAAWASRFPRYRVGLGALLFVLSDLLLFARTDGLAQQAADLLVWPTYYFGQFLICTGVIQTLRKESAA
jgi:uncharacterized membrane protein YhhN